MTDTASKLTYADAMREALTPIAPTLSPGPEYANDRRLFQGIPGIERAPGGRLWAVWYAGGQGESPLNYMVLFTSGDDGESWSGPVLVIDPPGQIRACDGNIWLDPEGRLWMFWMQTYCLHDGRWGVWAITTDHPDDPNPRWSAPRRLADGVMLNKPSALTNGEWHFPVSLINEKVLKNEKRMLPAFLRRYLLALMRPDEIEAVKERAGAWDLVTSDKGKTFTRRGRAQVPEGFSTHNEQMIAEGRDGTLHMLLRTGYGIGKSESADGGATWSPVVESGIPHTPSRFFFRRLQSGNWLLVKHGPMIEPPVPEGDGPVKRPRTHLTAYLSEDDGKSWIGGLLLEEGGCSYPDGTQAPDGTIYVIYDHGRRSEKEIRMARFSEADIRAGDFVSPRSQPNLLIDKATGVITDAEDWSHLKGKDDPDEPLIFTGI